MIPFTLSVYQLSVYFPKCKALIPVIKTPESLLLGIIYFMNFVHCLMLKYNKKLQKLPTQMVEELTKPRLLHTDVTTGKCVCT